MILQGMSGLDRITPGNPVEMALVIDMEDGAHAALVAKIEGDAAILHRTVYANIARARPAIPAAWFLEQPPGGRRRHRLWALHGLLDSCEGSHASGKDGTTRSSGETKSKVESRSPQTARCQGLIPGMVMPKRRSRNCATEVVIKDLDC